jgi:hypothetical protein
MLKDQEQASFSVVGRYQGLKMAELCHRKLTLLVRNGIQPQIAELSPYLLKIKSPVNWTFQKSAMSQFFSEQTAEVLPWTKSGLGLFPGQPSRTLTGFLLGGSVWWR